MLDMKYYFINKIQKLQFLLIAISSYSFIPQALPKKF